MSVFSVDSAAGDGNCVAASLDTTLPGRWKPTGVNYPWTMKAAPKPRKGTSRRAVFSDLQRQKLEDRFLLQKYISKPERKKLAESLGLKDSQVTHFFPDSHNDQLPSSPSSYITLCTGFINFTQFATCNETITLFHTLVLNTPVIFQRGEYTKPMSSHEWFFKGGSTQNRWVLMGDFSKGGVHKTDGF